jgi:hypothetical protein
MNELIFRPVNRAVVARRTLTEIERTNNVPSLDSAGIEGDFTHKHRIESDLRKL